MRRWRKTCWGAWVLAVGCFPRAPGPVPFPGPARADLEIPKGIWERIKTETGFAGRDLGRTDAEMSNYTPTAHVPRRLRRLFPDAREVPRMSGRTTDDLAQNLDKPAALAKQLFVLHDIGAPGSLEAAEDSWGVDWIPSAGAGDEAPRRRKQANKGPPPDPDTALPFVLGYGRDGAKEPDEAQREAWGRLPLRVRRLAVRLFVASAEAERWVRQAFPRDLEPMEARALFRLASQPWRDDRLPVDRASWDLMETADLFALASASGTFLRHTELALQEYGASAKGLAPLVLETSLGRIRIGTEGADVYPGGDLLVIDPGGDDRYEGRNAASAGRGLPVSSVFDLCGNDIYEGGEDPATLACGLLGVGVLADLVGNDRYRHKHFGLGAGLYGMGVLLDRSGDDVYESDEGWGQGMGCHGVGMLVDAGGNDRYSCRSESQGYGNTRGAGLLLDASGNDVYLGLPDGPTAPEHAFHENALSLCQGCGFGRRADSTDGRNLGGGFGIFVEMAGDDRYDAGCYSGGAGYWWGMGIFEDFAGDDTYDRSFYSHGASPHFGVGIAVDRAGDDTYNPVNGTGRLTLGGARDGGIAWFIDAGGNDRYRIGASSGGASSLCAIGVFWDRCGDDVYQVLESTRGEETEAYALGAASNGGDSKVQGPVRPRIPAAHKFGTFRDEQIGVGVFLDTGGKDSYFQPPTGPRAHGAADGSFWRHLREGNCATFGLDGEGYF